MSLFKLLAPKDEWEVARLYARPEFMEDLRRTFDGDLKLTFHVGAWPFGKTDKTTGKAIKGEVGGWLMKAFKAMSALRFLRGGPLDPFRNSQEARLARALLSDYEADLELVAGRLDAATLASATARPRRSGTCRGRTPRRRRRRPPSLADPARSGASRPDRPGRRIGAPDRCGYSIRRAPASAPVSASIHSSSRTTPSPS